MEKIVYLDNAATTKVFDEIFDLQRENNDCFYNPSATYSVGINSGKKLEDARCKLISLLHGKNGRLIFTSSATESNNMVLFGAHLRKGQAVLISKGEHPSIYNAAHELSKRGISVLDIPLTPAGVVDIAKFENLLKTNDVGLVSIIHVSNETGVVNDIKALVSLTKSISSKTLFHSDGVQAFGKIDVNIGELGVDFYTISSHKIHCVRGIAGLWVKNGINFDPLLYGGGQEFGLRSSTENVAGAISLAFAAEKVVKSLDENHIRVLKTRKNLIQSLISSKISSFFEINEGENQSPYILSLSFPGIKGEVLMNALQSDGIIISTGSACSSKKAGNRILEAMGRNGNNVIGSIRISFSAYEDYDVQYITSCIEKNVLRLIQNKKR